MDKKKVNINEKMMHELPVSAYTSKEWFDIEMKHLFSTTWQFAGFVEDVSEPGDYISVQAGLNNIFIIKGRDGRLRAFHNMCRHRGTQLLRAVGNSKKAITCPYHDWTYDLEGGLQSIPKKETEFPNLPKENHKCDLNLIKASVDVFKGMLFVHPDENAPSIMEFFGDVLPYLGPHIPESLVEQSEKDGKPLDTRIINCNWKIVVENYIDHYHLDHLHEGTLNMYDHKNAEFGWVGPHYWFYEPLIPEYRENVNDLSPYVLIDSVPEDQIGAYVPWLFPNIGLGETEGAWSIFHVIPMAPDKTMVVIRGKGMNVSDWEATKQYTKSGFQSFWTKYGSKGKYNGNPETDPMSSGDFMEEDVYACEQQQKSLTSPYFSVGAVAKRGEYAIAKFQLEVKKWIEKHNNNE
ncbi:MAG: aromatic ring-hydroxylating oxygenase subunit alpha [Flavobacteriales bacterium]